MRPGAALQRDGDCDVMRLPWRGRSATRGREPGRELDPLVRQRLEPRFQHSFSDVRLHDDAQADGLARGFHALAFTYGRDIYFRSGAFEPATGPGMFLIAHELSHTVQQSGAFPDTEATDSRAPTALATAELEEAANRQAAQALDLTTPHVDGPIVGAPQPVVLAMGVDLGGMMLESWRREREKNEAGDIFGGAGNWAVPVSAEGGIHWAHWAAAEALLASPAT